ncbi:hypothetical protein J6590_063210 [Homalodisca vitripennis]|nr:hypothetical protein J6590_063210 [Homalodisca vitripennis]
MMKAFHRYIVMRDEYIPNQIEIDELESDDDTLHLHNDGNDDDNTNKEVVSEEHENENLNDRTNFEVQEDETEVVINLPAETKKKKYFQKKWTSMQSGKSASEPDRRGKHMVRPNKTPAEVVGFVINHISSFPAEESHYSRHCNIHSITSTFDPQNA